MTKAFFHRWNVKSRKPGQFFAVKLDSINVKRKACVYGTFVLHPYLKTEPHWQSPEDAESGSLAMFWIRYFIATLENFRWRIIQQVVFIVC